MSGRCKACDVVLLETEIIWVEELKEHESLCTKCRTIVREAEDDMDTSILYPDDHIEIYVDEEP